MGVRIHEQLVGVEAKARRGLERAVHTVAVELTGTEARDIAVPDVPGHLRQRDRLIPVRLVDGVEQAQFDLRRTLGEEREIYAGAIPMCTERIGLPGQDATKVAPDITGRKLSNISSQKQAFQADAVAPCWPHRQHKTNPCGGTPTS